MFRHKTTQLIVDTDAWIAEITKIDAGLTKDTVLVQKLQTIFKKLTFNAGDLFLEGLEQAQEKSAYLSTWVKFLEKFTDNYNEEFSDIHQLFLKQYPWSFLNNPSFFGLIETLLKPEMKKLWPWFVHYFDPKLAVPIDQKVLEENIQLFQKFVDTCIKFKVTNTVSAPIVHDAVSFHLQGKNYIERCIHALEKSTQKETQAQLLHLLPNSNLIEQAFAKKLPLICSAMVHYNTVTVPSLTGLMSTFDYSSYKTKAMAYLSATGKMNFLDCFNFFNELDRVKSTKLDQDEKLLLAKAFTQYAQQQINPTDTDALIYWAREIKEVLGESHFTKLFEAPVQTNADLNDYISVCQLLIDLADEVDTEELLTNQAGNLPGLIRTLQTKQNECLLKKYPEKNLDDVLADFKNQSEFVKFPLSTAEIEQLRKDYIAIQDLAKDFVFMDPIQLQREAKACGEALKNSDDPASKLKLVAIIREMMRREFNLYPYNTQILSLLSLINSPKDMKGRIGQIRTGEGKSMIVAMLSAYMGSQGKTVDVITSSRYLAIRDQKKYHDFYAALGITSSHICYDQPEKKHFDGQILYSTNYDAEFSILRDTFFQQDLRYTTLNGKLVKRPFDVAIVDEVDNLFIDAALNSARLAIPAPELSAWIYEPVLKFVQNRGEALTKEAPDVLKQLRSLLESYQDGKFKQQVDTFSDKQLSTWMYSAYQAQFKKKLGKDYVIKPHPRMTAQGETMVPQVMIVDHKNTGRVMTDSRWGKGVHEFLEVKHGLQPKDESATLAAISHPAFFDYYKAIYGLTGTIGELQEREEIKKVYHIDTFDVPPHFPSQRKKNTPQCLATREAYHQAILDSIQAATKQGQPALTLFASIADSAEFSEFLRQRGVKHQLLNEVQREHEDYIIDRAGSPGTITIATNIAGRGADIILPPESKKAGGLHLVLGFYPANKRVEDQGEGRAGRQGQPGTCSMILHCEDEQIKKLIKEESERLALCNDPNFIDKLDKLRSQHIARESSQRIFQSKLEFIHYTILKQFGEIFECFSKSLPNIPLDLVASACSSIQKIPTSPAVSFAANPMLELLQKNAQYLLNQQLSGLAVGWKTFFLPHALNCYLIHVQQKWAKFFSKLDDQRSTQESIYLSDYQFDTQKEFAAFMNTTMREDLENPSAGFVRFLSQLFDVDLSQNLSKEYMVTQSNSFEEWYKKILPDSVGTNLIKIGIFEPGCNQSIVNSQSKQNLVI
ncbi:preprotein translocase subunit SecA [Legionella clemsonensis]|uniref:Preprotein translocase subunit SecA n=1 Tax=Legionella clemsonensis TaxID=1867846 RepID=A0A222P5B6_9GAMM|nr:hypothetical protein [Legionella clemsonensis]ASQ47007.1 preprotein translocase subunit SecA [Legionella clemsonensis]